jgi:hypothetical protein
MSDEKLLKLETGWKQQRQTSNNKDLHARTRNVQSLYRSSSLQNWIQVTQDYKTDLLAVQEARWLGRSITEIQTAQYAILVMITYFWNRLDC